MNQSKPAMILPHTRIGLLAAALILSTFCALIAGQKQIEWTDQEKPIVTEIRGLRGLPDDVRAVTTKRLALEIRQLPAGPNKLLLADALASRATEGDFGHATLQEVAATLAQALDQQQPPEEHHQPASAYVELASLVRYEHVKARANSPQFAAAMSKLEADDAARQKANFTLTDLQGKSWTLKSLRGKVVMVNFWATWCPPCRKEIPDLEALYRQFDGEGLVILGISVDEDTAKVPPFVQQYGMTYPVLLDKGNEVGKLFRVEGIPKSFVYDRDGKLAAESIDMRTRNQFLAMLAQAGLK
jgi:peroxiredoxin